MKILLLGSTGQVGWELNRTLLTLGELVALDYPEIDMANPNNIHQVVKEVKPDIIINATAYTDVDRAETEPKLAMAINGTGPGILAEEAKRLGAALIHYSTDYVFDGTKGEPYTEEDIPNPLNVYGKTKLTGEQIIRDISGTSLIFRTAWVYSLRRPCFVTKVLGWARVHETLRIVDDQISSPTWSRTLAQATTAVINQGDLPGKSGLYHLTDDGICSRFEWAKAILENDLYPDEHVFQQILPAKSSDFTTLAIRPMVSALDCGHFINTFGLPLTGWRENLELALAS